MLEIFVNTCSATGPYQLSIVNNIPYTIQAYIQGYWDASTHFMYPVLSNQGIGTSTTDVDSITVEFRDTVVTSNVLYSQSGVLSTSRYCTIEIPSTMFGNVAVILIKIISTSQKQRSIFEVHFF